MTPTAYFTAHRIPLTPVAEGSGVLRCEVRSGFTMAAQRLLGIVTDDDVQAVHALNVWEVVSATLPHEQTEAGYWQSQCVTAADGTLFLVADGLKKADTATFAFDGDGHDRVQLVAVDGDGKVEVFPFYFMGEGQLSRTTYFWHSGEDRTCKKPDGSVVFCSNALSASRVHLLLKRAAAEDAEPTFEPPSANEASEDSDAQSLYRSRLNAEVAWMQFPNRSFGRGKASALNYYGADRIVLFDNDGKTRRRALQVARSFPVMQFADLGSDVRQSVLSVSDTGDVLRAILLSETVNPFYRHYKKNKKDEVIGVEYRINCTRIWTFMASLGYATYDDGKTCGLVVQDADTGILRFRERERLAELTRMELLAYAPTVCDIYDWDFFAVRDSIGSSRDIDNKGFAFLPRIDVVGEKSYGPELDYFFYRNGCLKITPEAITWHDGYDDLPFTVFEDQILDFDFVMPSDAATRPPFILDENPEYVQRIEAYEEHQRDRQHSQDELDVEQTELTRWAQHHRWRVRFPQSVIRDDGTEDRSHWWKTMLVLRGYANNRWRDEFELNRLGKDFDAEQQGELQAHLANIIYTIGHLLYRYRTDVNYISYIMENADIDETKSEGGTGKSTLVNIICGCAGYVRIIDGKSILSNTEFALKLAAYNPRRDRIIHFEDCKSDFPFDNLFNYATTGIIHRDFHAKASEVPVEESPGLALTSNFAPSGNDSSSHRRRCVCGISHYFYANKHGNGRPIREVCPDIGLWKTEQGTTTRSQFAYICALAVQFCMTVKGRVEQPSEMADLRADYASYGRPFVLYATELLANEKHYGVPMDANTLFDEYKSVCEPSELRKGSYSLRKFRENLITFAAARDVLVNPDVCYSPQSNDKAAGRMPRFRSWVRQAYFEADKWKGVQDVVYLRKLSERSVYTIWLFHKGKVPADYETVKLMAKQYVSGPDPEPYLDDDGKPITSLTIEAKKAFAENVLRTLGVNIDDGTLAASATPLKTSNEKAEPAPDLPF